MTKAFFSLSIAVIFAAGLVYCTTTQAASQYWDVNGATAGFAANSTGTWDAAGTNWNTDSTGGAGGTVAAWGPGNAAFFVHTGTASTITVSGTQSAASLNFKTGGAQTLTLAGSTLDVNGAMAINVDAGSTGNTITALISASSGETVTYNGNSTGTLTMGSNQTNFNGEFILTSGNLNFSNESSLGTTSSTAKFTINGGTITSSTGARSLQVRQIDIGGNFAFNMSTNAVDLHGNDANTAQGSAVITLLTTPTITGTTTGTVAFTLGGAIGESSGGSKGITKAGTGFLTLTNPNNSYSGDTTILDGQLRVDADATLGNGTGKLILAGAAAIVSPATPATNPKLNVFVPGGRTAPINNPIQVSGTGGSIVTTTNTDVQVDLGGVLSGSAGTLTFKNELASAGSPLTVFNPHLTNSSNFTFSQPMVIDNGSNKTNLGFYSASGTQTFSGDISGTGSITRAASGGTGGVTVLSGNNTYSGGTTINGGTLQVANAPGTSGTGTGGVVVNSDGTLSGTGSVSGSVTVNTGGTVAPGASIGTLAIGSLSLTAATSTLSMEVDPSLSPAADLLSVTGSVSLGTGTLALTLLNAPLSLGSPKVFMLVDNDSNDPITGTLSITGVPNGYAATIDYAFSGTDSLGRVGTGNDLAITLMTAVPEPSAFLFGGMICLLIGLTYTGKKLCRRSAGASNCRTKTELCAGSA